MTQFYFPPRPEKAILPSMINFYEKRGFIAQRKRNGTCSTASVDDKGNVTFFTRHGVAHKAWTPTEEAKAWFGQYPDSYFVFELLHSKGGGVRDTIYIFDVVKMQGTDHVGFPLIDRLCLLKRVASERKDIRGTTLPAGFDGALSRPVRSARRRRRAERPGSRPSRMSS